MHTVAQKEYQRLWYLKNRERLIAESKEYYRDHWDERKAHRTANAPRLLAAAKKYAAEHRPQINEWKRKDRAKDPEKARREKRAWFARTPKSKEKARLAAKAYYHANRDAVKVTRLAYYEKNKDKIRDRKRRYVAKNREKVYSSIHRRRALKRNSGGNYTKRQWMDLVQSTGHICLCCGTPESERPLTRDHVIPISKGGSNLMTIMHLTQNRFSAIF